MTNRYCTRCNQEIQQGNEVYLECEQFSGDVALYLSQSQVRRMYKAHENYHKCMDKHGPVLGIGLWYELQRFHVKRFLGLFPFGRDCAEHEILKSENTPSLFA